MNSLPSVFVVFSLLVVMVALYHSPYRKGVEAPEEKQSSGSEAFPSMPRKAPSIRASALIKEQEPRNEQVPQKWIDYALAYIRARTKTSHIVLLKVGQYSQKDETMTKSIRVPIIKADSFEVVSKTLNFTVNTEHIFNIDVQLERAVERSFHISISVDFEKHAAVTTFYSNDNVKARAHAKSLSVVSANIFNYNYWELRKPLVKKELKRLNADVYCFQEVRSRKISSEKNDRYQVEDLAAMLKGYEFVYQPAMTFEETSVSPPSLVHEGLAIFSRFPIQSTFALKLSRDKNDSSDFHQRILLKALVNTPFGPVNIMNTHLSLSKAARTRTILEIGRYSLSLKPSRAVLVGDFNEDEMSFVENLQGKFGFEDVWTKLKPSQRNQMLSFTFHSWDLRSRIDYVLCRGLLPDSISTEAKESIAVSSLKPQAGVSDTKDTLYVSDHLFLMAYFRPDPAHSMTAESKH